MLITYSLGAATYEDAVGGAQQRATAEGWYHLGIGHVHRSGSDTWSVVIEAAANKFPGVG